MHLICSLRYTQSEKSQLRKQTIHKNKSHGNNKQYFEVDKMLDIITKIKFENIDDR